MSLLPLGLSLAGCASKLPAMAPAPAIDMPTAWSAGGWAGERSNGVDANSLTAWWRRFDEPLLAELVNRALAANTRVNGAQAAVQQAQALRDAAAAALSPSLGARASAQRGRQGGDSTGNRLTTGLDALWAPDVFGARQRGLDASEAAAAASLATLGDTQVQVAAEVALNLILLRALQWRWVIARDNLASQRQTQQITSWRLQAGLVTSLQAEQAAAATAQTQALLPLLETSIQQTAHALAVLVGVPPKAMSAELGSATTPDRASSRLPSASGELALGIPADTLRQRADVRAAEHQVAAALARLNQAHAQRWPSFSIGGSIGLSAISLATLGSSAAVLSSVLASVSLPVLDGGAAQAQVRAQAAALEQARQTYRAAVLRALQDVEDVLEASHNNRLRLDSLQLAAGAAGRAAALARQRYGSGLVDFQTVLDTQRNQLATQDSVVSARADVANDQVRLFTALGGGWRVDGGVPDALPPPLTPQTREPR